MLFDRNTRSQAHQGSVDAAVPPSAAWQLRLRSWARQGLSGGRAASAITSILRRQDAAATLLFS